MLIFKTKSNIFKKINNSIIAIFFVVILVFSSIILPSLALAVNNPTITLMCAKASENAQKKWSLEFSITTTEIPDGATISVGVLQNGTLVPPQSSSTSLLVKNGQTVSNYNTDYILDSDTKYTVTAFYHSGDIENGVSVTTSQDITTPKDGGTTLPQCLTTTIAPPPTCTSTQVLDPATNTCITPAVNTDTTYTLLAPLPFMGLDGTTPTIDTLYNKDTNPCPFGKYLNVLIKLFLGICGVLAVIMIVWGGIQYMTSELASSKEAGKESIRNAILGLLLALGAWLILNTINPDLLNVCLNNLPTASITISPEQAVLIKNRGGGGNCAVITNTSSPCYPSTIEKSGFGGNTSANEPFKKISAQASAICQLESGATANSPIGKTPNQILDKCSDNKPFSFGLFQINAAAHMTEIPACNGAFEVPAGTSQGSCMPGQRDPKTGVCVQWSCKTIEPAYTKCQNYLTNPANNIAFAAGKTLYGRNKWAQWSTYASCNNKF